MILLTQLNKSNYRFFNRKLLVSLDTTEKQIRLNEFEKAFKTHKPEIYRQLNTVINKITSDNNIRTVQEIDKMVSELFDIIFLPSRIKLIIRIDIRKITLSYHSLFKNFRIY